MTCHSDITYLALSTSNVRASNFSGDFLNSTISTSRKTIAKGTGHSTWTTHIKKPCYRGRTARRAVSVENCYNKLYNKSNPKQMKVTELEGYSRPTCNKLYVSSHYASNVVSVIPKLDRRRVLLTTVIIDLPWRKFLKSRVWDKVSEGSTLILEVPEFLYNTV